MKQAFCKYILLMLGLAAAGCSSLSSHEALEKMEREMIGDSLDAARLRQVFQIPIGQQKLSNDVIQLRFEYPTHCVLVETANSQTRLILDARPEGQAKYCGIGP